MPSKRALATRLAAVEAFQSPRVELEQYQTPAELAATLVHTADLQGDIADRLILDLGCGTGMLALAATVFEPAAVVGLELDGAALETARRNERTLSLPQPVSWVRGDVTRSPLCPQGPVTVLMNPPFGAQTGNEHADRAFLDTAATVADVSYSVHNAGSADFVEAFAKDTGGTVTHAFAAQLDLPRAFEFHHEDSRTIDVEVFRTVWNAESATHD